MDENGLLRADARIPLSVCVEGDARLLAFGGMKALHRKGYGLADTTSGEGHALAVLKRTGDRGRIKVTVTGAGLKEQVIEM